MTNTTSKAIWVALGCAVMLGAWEPALAQASPVLWTSTDVVAKPRAVRTPLSHDELDVGFSGIARSADQCLSRFRKKGETFPLESIRVEVTIKPNGRVSRMVLPRKVRWSAFGRCMKAHSDRWLFPVFEGRPIRAAKVFRVAPE